EKEGRKSRSGSSSSSSSSGSSSSGSRSSSSSSSSSSSRSPSPKNKRRASKSPARRSPARRSGGTRRSPSNDRRPRRRSGSPPRRRSPSPPRRRQRRCVSILDFSLYHLLQVKCELFVSIVILMLNISNHTRGRDRAARRSRTRSPRKASPPKKLCVRHLSRNVSKDHLHEIFAIYGALKNCELPSDRNHPHLGRGYGYIEYENVEDAEKAIKHMDGGQIDGQVIQVEITHTPAPVVRRSPPRRSPPRRGYSPKGRRTPPYRGGTGGNNAPLGASRRFGGGGGGRSRSRSPVRRRRSRS
ncbi:hypothetical protein PMAYCL1PPCAC_11853, partial [Pristionchus mayeri]